MTMGLETSPRYVLFVFYNSFFFLWLSTGKSYTSKHVRTWPPPPLWPNKMFGNPWWGRGRGKEMKAGAQDISASWTLVCFFFFLSSFFTNIYVQKLFIQPPPAPCTATPAAPPPICMAWKRLVWKGSKWRSRLDPRARDASASRAPCISTCTGSLISVE